MNNFLLKLVYAKFNIKLYPKQLSILESILNADYSFVVMGRASGKTMLLTLVGCCLNLLEENKILICSSSLRQAAMVAKLNSKHINAEVINIVDIKGYIDRYDTLLIDEASTIVEEYLNFIREYLLTGRLKKIVIMSSGFEVAFEENKLREVYKLYNDIKNMNNSFIINNVNALDFVGRPNIERAKKECSTNIFKMCYLGQILDNFNDTIYER